MQKNNPLAVDLNLGKAKRTYRGMVVSPREQAKLVIVFIASGIAAMAAFFVLFTANVIAHIDELAVYRVSPNIIRVLLDGVQDSARLMGIICVGVAAITIGAGFFLSHRIYGPMISFRRQVNALIKGDYRARGRLREKDEFQEIMTLLNELASDLEKRHPR